MDLKIKALVETLRKNPKYVATFEQFADIIEKNFANQASPSVAGFTQEQVALITSIALGVGAAVKVQLETKLDEVRAELAPHLVH